jgi:hypothetical protein
MCEPTGDDSDLASEIRYVVHTPGGMGWEGLLREGEDKTHAVVGT